MATALIGAGIEVGKAAIDLLEKRKGASSARSVGIRLRNRTTEVLSLADHRTMGGIWTEGVEVPNEVPALGWGTWMAESHGVATGTEGYCVFNIGDTGAKLYINFNNPYIGGNTNSVGTKPDDVYKASYEGGSGNNCYLTVTLQGGATAAPAADSAAPVVADGEAGEGAEEGGEEAYQEGGEEAAEHQGGEEGYEGQEAAYEEGGEEQQAYEGGEEQPYEGEEQAYEGGEEQAYEGGEEQPYEGGEEQAYAEGGEEAQHEGGGEEEYEQ